MAGIRGNVVGGSGAGGGKDEWLGSGDQVQRVGAIALRRPSRQLYSKNAKHAHKTHRAEGQVIAAVHYIHRASKGRSGAGNSAEGEEFAERDRLFGSLCSGENGRVEAREAEKVELVRHLMRKTNQQET